MKAREIRPFDILKNTLSGELGLVVEVAENKVHLADRTGLRAIYKLGEMFVFVDNDATGFKLAALAGMRERRRLAVPPKKKRAGRVKKEKSA